MSLGFLVIVLVVCFGFQLRSVTFLSLLIIGSGCHLSSIEETVGNSSHESPVYVGNVSLPGSISSQPLASLSLLRVVVVFDSIREQQSWVTGSHWECRPSRLRLFLSHLTPSVSSGLWLLLVPSWGLVASTHRFTLGMSAFQAPSLSPPPASIIFFTIFASGVGRLFGCRLKARLASTVQVGWTHWDVGLPGFADSWSRGLAVVTSVYCFSANVVSIESQIAVEAPPNLFLRDPLSEACLLSEFPDAEFVQADHLVGPACRHAFHLDHSLFVQANRSFS